MDINPLISEIRRGLWSLDITNIHAYTPVIQNLLAGQAIAFPGVNKASSLMNILDNYGNIVRPAADGSVSIPPNSIAQVSMIGEVIKTGDFCTYGADEIVAALYKAQENTNIDATVFKIDGPGGAVSAIDVFRDFAKNKTKPIIGLLGDALSLHYWTAVSCCDYLISDGDVSPRFGSVGVVCSFMDTRKALEEKGYIKVDVYADESEHKNEAFRLALDGKFELIKSEHLSPLAVKFQESVRAGRPNLKEETGVLTGKTFYADEALRLGMIDDIGNIKTAIQKARGLALSQTISKSNK